MWKTSYLTNFETILNLSAIFTIILVSELLKLSSIWKFCQKFNSSERFWVFKFGAEKNFFKQANKWEIFEIQCIIQCSGPWQLLFITLNKNKLTKKRFLNSIRVNKRLLTESACIFTLCLQIKFWMIIKIQRCNDAFPRGR